MYLLFPFKYVLSNLVFARRQTIRPNCWFALFGPVFQFFRFYIVLFLNMIENFTFSQILMS